MLIKSSEKPVEFRKIKLFRFFPNTRENKLCSFFNETNSNFTWPLLILSQNICKVLFHFQVLFLGCQFTKNFNYNEDEN